MPINALFVHDLCMMQCPKSWPPPNLSRFAWINSGKGVQHRRRWGGPVAILHYAANHEWQNMLIRALSRLSLRLHLDPPKRWSVSTPLPKIRNADLGGRSRLHRQFRTAVPLNVCVHEKFTHSKTVWQSSFRLNFACCVMIVTNACGALP